MKQYDYLIVGSGLFGATMAYLLKQKGRKVLVVEKREHLGGNIYTEKVEGIDVHRYGAHIFHTDDRKIWDFVNSLVPFDYFVNSPIARYHDECYNLPFNMNTFNKLWPDVFTPKEAQRRIEEERKENYVENPKNLEEQAINLVGKTIYHKLIEGYTEKQWGRPCKELPAFIIRRLPVRFTYDNNYFNDRYQGIPHDGYTALIEKLLEGCEVRLKNDYLRNKAELNALAEKVIYTGPLDVFYDYKYGYLEYRSVRFETKIYEEENHQGVAVVNYTDKDVPYTRSIEHRHFSRGVTSKKTVVSYEYSSEWRVGEEPYYAVNDERNKELFLRYKADREQEKNVYFGGRLADYRYYDMDDTIEAAFKLSETLF